MAIFASYRRGAGRKTRAFATFLLIALLAWLSYSLLDYGNTRLDRLLGFEEPVFGKQLVSGASSLTEWVTWSVFIAVAVFVVGLFGIRAFLNRPGYADLLIETQAELKRVRWAPRKEVSRATGVVLYFIFWFALLMFVYDLTFTMGTQMLQGRSWNEAGWGRVVTMVLRLDDDEETTKTS